jgi:hypothetical protein
MLDVFLAEFWRTLKGQLPCLTAYLIGIALAWYYWRRDPGPCLFLFLACSVKLIVAVISPAAAVLLIRRQDASQLEIVMTALDLVDASAYGLLFLAVFHGRKKPPTVWHESWNDDELPRDGADHPGGNSPR